MVGPVAKREAVAHLRSVLEMSERRACTLVAADRTMIRYRSRRPPDTALRARLRELANERRRFGYRRLFILLRREGEASGINRIYRLYRDEGLTVRKRRARRRAIGIRAPILVEARVNARWSLDFVHDQMANGRRFRVLNIVDDVTRECLAAIPDTSISGMRVARELTDLVARRGKPGMIVSDNGTEFTSHAIFAWAKDHAIEWHYIGPGKPAQNRSVESFRRADATSSMRATLSRNGRKTTTRVARIRRSTTRHRRPLPPNSPQQAITLRSVMAPRAGLLLTPPERAYSCRDSNPRWGILQWQVTRWLEPAL